MNQKIAKALRRAAGYTNRSKTPTTYPFPGIVNRGYEADVVDRQGRVVRDTRTGDALKHLIPVTAAITADEKSPRASYRKLKRLMRDPRFRADVMAAADGVENDLSRIVGAPTIA